MLTKFNNKNGSNKIRTVHGVLDESSSSSGDSDSACDEADSDKPTPNQHNLRRKKISATTQNE